MDFLSGWTQQLAGRGTDLKANELNKVLKKANSEWTVARFGDRFTLVQSVSAGVPRTLDQTLNRDGHAAVEVQQAFMQAFGVHRSPSDAYFNAAGAVETAALTVVKVNKQDATPGNVSPTSSGRCGVELTFVPDAEMLPVEVTAEVTREFGSSEVAEQR